MKFHLRSLSLVYISLIYAFLYIPAVLVVAFSFNRSRFWTFPLKGFTFRWYTELMARPEALQAMKNSFTVAVPTMIISVLLGGAIAVAFYRQHFRFKGAAEGLILMPQLLPTLIWGIALLLFLSSIKAPMGPVTVVIGHVLYTTPYVLLLLNARYRTLDPNLENAARSLGATAWMTFRRIILPQLLPAFASGGLIAFAISFSDLILAFFLSGGGFNTLPIYIYSLIQFEPSPVVNAVATIVFVVALVTIILSMVIGGRETVLVGERKSNAK